MINHNVYLDTHKWIVCLIGSDSFRINSFLSEHIEKLKESANLSISVMALSTEPLAHSKEYRALCESTNEGVYVNIVDRNKADRVTEKFSSTMDVYPSSKIPIMREFFQVL